MGTSSLEAQAWDRAVLQLGAWAWGMDLISARAGLAGFGLRPTAMEGLTAESKLRGRG